MTNWLNHHGSCQSIMDVVNDHVIPDAGLGATEMKNKPISHEVCVTVILSLVRAILDCAFVGVLVL